MLPVLRVGSKGDLVKVLQMIIGVTPDGSFGNQTAERLKYFQNELGLVADGVCGPNTWNKLL